MSMHNEVMRVLKETSRTFYIPVSRLPSKLQETVAAAYLCMRAIDEIEDCFLDGSIFLRRREVRFHFTLGGR